MAAKLGQLLLSKNILSEDQLKKGLEEQARSGGRLGSTLINMGIINEDQLGLDVIYIQAKRWEGTVGRPEIQKFAGALQGQRVGSRACAAVDPARPMRS